jgi:ketopantoate reductase
VQVFIWRKLIANVSNDCVAAITGFTGNQMLACKPICDLIARLAEELALVVRAEGLDFEGFNDPAGFVLNVTLPGAKIIKFPCFWMWRPIGGQRLIP